MITSSSSLFGLFIFSWFLVECNGGWIDPDTKPQYYKAKSYTKDKDYELVFSDEFDIAGRSFHDGSDPKWTAINKDDYTNFALQYYNSSLVRTENGYLNISSIIKDVEFYSSPNGKKTLNKKNYQSGMIQGWNKFCFTSGVLEISAQLPGHHDIGGLWPAMWLLGNLARATYVSSSNNIWPWSYDTCDTELQPQQFFSKCNKINHFNLHPSQGRGAPEIDMLEVMAGKEKLINTPINKPYYSTSLQIAPANKNYRPTATELPDYDQWYNHGLDYGENTSLNIFFYGMYLEGTSKEKSYRADAISANTNLTESHFTSQHVYRLEWETGPEGFLEWYLDDKFVFRIESSTLNLTGALMPEEPMYLLINTAISYTWGFPEPCPEGCPCSCFDCRLAECACGIPNNFCQNFPAYFLVDYIRLYQDKSNPNHTIGCSTQNHPTKKFIDAHPYMYMSEHDKVPLKPIQHGQGSCKVDSDCGSYGRCSTHLPHVCECLTKNFTGPHCLAANGFNDENWEIPDNFRFYGFVLPSILIYLFIGIVLMLCTTVFYKYYQNVTARNRSWSYSSIPTDDNSTRDLTRSSSNIEMHNSNHHSMRGNKKANSMKQVLSDEEANQQNDSSVTPYQI